LLRRRLVAGAFFLFKDLRAASILFLGVVGGRWRRSTFLGTWRRPLPRQQFGSRSIHVRRVLLSPARAVGRKFFLLLVCSQVRIGAQVFARGRTSTRFASHFSLPSLGGFPLLGSLFATFAGFGAFSSFLQRRVRDRSRNRAGAARGDFESLCSGRRAATRREFVAF